MSRSLIEITRDLVLAKNEYEIFNEEDLMARVDELFTELHSKEDGIYWLYKESEKEISLFEEQIKKLKTHTTVMKKAQLYLLVERLMDCCIYPCPPKYCLAFALLSAGLACSLLSPDASIFAFANSF